MSTKLSNIIASDYAKVLIYGESGTGKTVFASSFPYPTLLLDFDGKVSSASNFYAKDPERLAGIDVEVLSPKPGFDPIEKLISILKILEDNIASGNNPYKTLVLDSLTTFSTACLNHIVKSNPGIKRVSTRQGSVPGLQDYGILKREFARLIPGLLALDMNIVMTGHIHTDKDETTGELHRRTKLDGSFSEDLPIYFEEVYRAYTDKGNYLAQTQTDFRFKCRTQRGLSSPIKLSYSSLIKE